ncbi:ESX secretion-associated protein EspG [Nocardia cyriacigeorgica]|uniref:ESX secretion-associated protein EspG n=1 Tax=Nocardia cyriacigeorgica TaxID=135487 RepID=UPI0018961B07|nr:ESX secretion-associated protein EspG [Nocardia cyriacigeorgica]MBF6085577.1 ESX secretion-associated protein EspG [Nocardia cyriacigeorgica]MBF6091666.1 ESX secretion-associated protein EspG [Nocardia cyriacigeorgica]MBF6394698.1 ESX secretion-associated protein EspG [Nocardia cyriacigeorgica]MBF6400332.1 ESX secretion-associated protein EspG [Nocardia cyriacigeorgica]
MKWVLTPDEFSYVWQNETDLDRRPYPVNMAPAATVRTESEHLRLRLPQRFARQADPDLAAALMLCARADATTITVSGERTASGAGDCPDRILAFAAVVHQHAAILVAAPTTVTVLMSHARALGELLVEVIGPARPGRAGTLREPQDAVLGATDHAGNGQTFSTNGERGAARFRRALRKPVDARGFITVTVEPDNPMSPPTRHRTWLDVSGDGRYLLTTADELTLMPVSDADFADQLLKLAQIR